MRKTLTTIFFIFALTALLFLVADFLLTACGIEPFGMRRKAQSFVTGTRHPVYHHELKPNLDNTAAWGTHSYRLCTNQYGFKVSCDPKKQPAGKAFDLAFMGDSFTEAVGMAYEDSFVGLYAAKHPNISVINLGFSSYSPSIYFKKMEYLLKNGFTFKHIVVLPDISDIQDEAVSYVIDPDTGRVRDKWRPKGEDESREELTAGNPPSPQKPPRNIWEKYFKYTWYINLQLDALLHPARAKLESFDHMRERAFWTSDPNTQGYGEAGVAGGIAQAVDAMSALKRLLDAHHIRMSVVVYPWPSQLMHNKPGHPGVSVWRDFCAREKCADFIDADDFFFEQVRRHGLVETLNKYYIAGDAHFNKEGNRALFEEIDRKLVP